MANELWGVADREPIAAIGLVVGEGTGPELAATFEEAIDVLARGAGIAVRVERCAHLFRSFGSALAADRTAPQVAAAAAEDAARYERFVRDFAARGGRVVFRTAFNAQSLYTVRERLLGVKLETLPGNDGEILLARDQTQGFYAGANDDPAVSPDRIERTTVFSRATTERVLDFVLAEARGRWGRNPDHFVMAFKFHLIDTRFADWVAAYGRARGLDVRVLQPDTMNRSLQRGGWRGNVAIVGSNEWGDIMHAELLQRAGFGAQDERCSRNVYLAEGVEGLVEMQTVHGSADDIAGLGRVNPSGTLRAAAWILEAHAGVAGCVARVEAALRAARARGDVTPDVGGVRSTAEMARAVLASATSPEPPLAHAEALLVIDLQNDFCAGDGRFAELGLIEPAALRALGARAGDLVERARAAGIPIAFVHTHADRPGVPPNVMRRHARTGRAGYLAAGSAGAAPFAVAPLPGEARFVKGGYDAFLGTGLETWLRELGVRRVTLAGVFTDVCIDAAARSAFQLGFEVGVAGDATLALEAPPERALGFMERFYDATVEDVGALAKRWSEPRSRAC